MQGVYRDVHEQDCAAPKTKQDASKTARRKNKARRTQVKARGGFSTGAYIGVREQEKTPRNEGLHSVFFVFYFIKEQKAR